MTKMPSFRRPALIADKVYEHLRHEVMIGSLTPGVWLREQELASRLSVSRTPVREAVRRLAQEQLLEVEPNRGVRVREVSVQEALDAYDVRELLEGMAARLCAEHASPKQLQDLEKRLVSIDKAPSHDYVRQISADIAFHAAVARASGNASLTYTLETLNTYILRFKIITRDRNQETSTQAQHQTIMKALLDRDPQAAEQAMQAHIRSFKAVLKERLEQAA